MYQRDFDLNEFMRQLRRMKTVGSMRDIMKMVPGISAQMDGMDIDETELDRFEAVILSMTPKERRCAETIGVSRLHRIARGSGTQQHEVLALFRSFYLVRDMLCRMNTHHHGF